MTVQDWISLGTLALGVALFVLGMVLSFIRKVKAKKEKKEPITAEFVITELVKSAVDAVKSNEKEFALLCGNSGVKAGLFKRERVLRIIQGLCADKGIPYVETEWSEITNKLVELININRPSTQSVLGSAGKAGDPVGILGLREPVQNLANIKYEVK